MPDPPTQRRQIESSFEPPDTRLKASINRFHIIPDRCGHYIVRDEFHLHGGYFVSRTDARKYALGDAQSAQQESIVTSLANAKAASFRPSTVVR